MDQEQKMVQEMDQLKQQYTDLNNRFLDHEQEMDQLKQRILKLEARGKASQKHSNTEKYNQMTLSGLAYSNICHNPSYEIIKLGVRWLKKH